MRRWLKRAALVLALAVFGLTFLNASWLAPEPRGSVKLIAHRGVYQNFDHRKLGLQDCTATRIEPPVHDYLENTTRSMERAKLLGARMVEIDIAPTRDGRIAVFHDWTVDCRTEASGGTREFSMAELKALDIGYGYTADGGKTFPFRGKGVGAMPTLEEALAALPRTPILFNFKSQSPVEADALAAALEAAGRDVEGIGDAFYGHPAPVARIAGHYPASWAWSVAEARECTMDYVAYGWTGVVPQSCENGTLIVPLNYQWAFWGWPNRLIARMEDAGGRVLVVGPYGEGDAPMGLALPEQLGEVPASFNGYLFVEDIWTVGPALYPSLDRRRPNERARAEKALERRRAMMD